MVDRRDDRLRVELLFVCPSAHGHKQQEESVAKVVWLRLININAHKSQSLTMRNEIPFYDLRRNVDLFICQFILFSKRSTQVAILREFQRTYTRNTNAEIDFDYE